MCAIDKRKSLNHPSNKHAARAKKLMGYKIRQKKAEKAK